MPAALSAESLQRAQALADWAEANNQHSPFWAHPEYQARFADTTDAELGAAAQLLQARVAEREQQATVEGLLTVGRAIIVAGLQREVDDAAATARARTTAIAAKFARATADFLEAKAREAKR
jgi:hypothetical protein